MTEEFKRPEDYTGEVPAGYEIREVEVHNLKTNEIRWVKQLVELPPKSDEEMIEDRIKELKMKLIKKTITEDEKEELKLLQA